VSTTAVQPLFSSIKRFFPNNLGTRVLICDHREVCYLYNPAAYTADCLFLRLPDFPTGIKVSQVVWDSVDRDILHILDETSYLHTYVYLAVSIAGPSLVKVGHLEISKEGDVTTKPVAYEIRTSKYGLPVLACKGSLLFLGQKKARILRAPSYPEADIVRGKEREASLVEMFKRSLALLHLKKANTFAYHLNKRSFWLALCSKAIEVVNIPMAIEVYRALGDGGMVVALEKLQHVEDESLVAGHVASLFGRYSHAEKLFLASSRPAAAVDLHRDLLQFRQALELAHTVAPQDVGAVALEYAEQLEMQQGDYEGALRIYERAEKWLANGSITCHQSLMKCKFGSTRCTLRIGHVKKGMDMVLSFTDEKNRKYGMTDGSDQSVKNFMCECARILESTKATKIDAAALYLRAGKKRRAACIYIEEKDFAHAAPLVEELKAQKLHGLYAKACEEDGKDATAILAYEKAGDRDNVIRLCLLSDPHKAFTLVREAGCVTGALLAARHCRERGDITLCLDFMLLAEKSDEAFEMAKSHHALEDYARLLLEKGKSVQHILDFHLQSHAWVDAGRLYDRLRQIDKALSMFLRAGTIEEAMRIVVKKGDSSSAEYSTLVAFLSEGPGKDLRCLSQLSVALTDGPLVVDATLARADEMQADNKYAEARSVVHVALQDLTRLNMPLATIEPLRLRFVVLHSYFLVTILLRQGDHINVAYILLRVARHAACFPGHLIRLFSSVVLQCERAGLTSAAHYYAALLIAKPQYRQELDRKICRTIETIVRRQSVTTDRNMSAVDTRRLDLVSPCPICHTPLPVTELTCPGPHSAALPMCIVSGRHMEREDWCICPNSGLPALFSAYLRYIETEGWGGKQVLDPICGKPIVEEQLTRLTPEEVDALLLKHKLTENKKEEYDEKTAISDISIHK